MSRACCALILATKVFGMSALRDPLLIHKATYIAQKLFGLRLGYRFAWLSSGPYSRSLSKELTTTGIPCQCNIKNIEEVSAKITNLLARVCKCTDLPPDEALDVIAGIVMLSTDVYPVPSDVVGELKRRKPSLRREVIDSVVKILLPYLRVSKQITQ